MRVAAPIYRDFNRAHATRGREDIEGRLQASVDGRKLAELFFPPHAFCAAALRYVLVAAADAAG
jgi:hypothetical protein